MLWNNYNQQYDQLEYLNRQVTMFFVLPIIAYLHAGECLGKWSVNRSDLKMKTYTTQGRQGCFESPMIFPISPDIFLIIIIIF